MRFLVDNALSQLLAQRLVEEGYDTVHIREYNMQSASDEDIFRLAQREDRIIISADYFSPLTSLLLSSFQNFPSFFPRTHPPVVQS